MANQQGNKTKMTDPTSGRTGQSTSGTGTGAAADANRTGASPGSGQDTRNVASSTGASSTANTAGSTPNTTTPNQSAMSTSGVGGLDTSHELPSGTDMRSKAEGIVDQVKDAASGAYDAATNTASSKLEEHKGELSTGLRTLADTFRKTGNDLKGNSQATALTDLTAKYTGTAAKQIDKVANYFERKDMRAVMRDAQDFARRNPAIFLGAAFGLGMLAARFLKSSPPNESDYSTRSNSLNTGTTGMTAGSHSSTSMPRNA